MTHNDIGNALARIFKKYQNNFSETVYTDDYRSFDVLMETFGITQELKQENKQFWGRQLGMCWQLLVVELCKRTNATCCKNKRMIKSALSKLLG